jgi:signal transduction histidine kinase
VREDFERTIEEKKATVTIGELPQIIGEPFQVNQLFHHLLDNALKFSSSDPHISVSSREITLDDYAKYTDLNKQMNYFVIDVSDNGIGFDEMFSDKIFHLFQQLRDDDEVKGTGVGLALCRKIVETHGGFLFGHGKKGVGAVFTVYFPVR